MRRSDREITDLGEILSIINDCKVIHLAMVDDGEPYLLPLNFGYACEGGAFSFFCHSAREGRKLDILRKNPTVAFEMGLPRCARRARCRLPVRILLRLRHRRRPCRIFGR